MNVTSPSLSDKSPLECGETKPQRASVPSQGAWSAHRCWRPPDSSFVSWGALERHRGGESSGEQHLTFPLLLLGSVTGLTLNAFIPTSPTPLLLHCGCGLRTWLSFPCFGALRCGSVVLSLPRYQTRTPARHHEAQYCLQFS